MVQKKNSSKGGIIWNRREVLAGSVAAVSGLSSSAPRAGRQLLADLPCNALGERVGEVTHRSAIVHTRLTESPTRNEQGYSVPFWTHNLSVEQRKNIRLPQGMKISELEGACPGITGQVRLLFGTDSQLSLASRTDWAAVGPGTDYTHKFLLEDLQADTEYFYSVEMRRTEGERTREGPIGRFRTAPDPKQWKPCRFFAITCQDYACRDHPRGYRTYEAMNRIGADFLVSTGDNVYYDLDLPHATSVDLARYHWHRMYSQPSLVELFRNMHGYWLKDDHDSFEDDDWPERPPQRVAPMTYQDLAPVFSEQVPIGEPFYRRVRWGRGLEMWLVENRDFRSPNSLQDGPGKSIWGKEQREWLKKTLQGSDASFQILISPTCIVGPDLDNDRVFQLPGGGADSHCRGFDEEGREFRRWVRDNLQNNLIVINGDRHWQYHSIDPDTGLNEFSCGAVTDSHSVAVPHSPVYHQFLRCKGGFISVTLEGEEKEGRLIVQHHDVNGHTVHQASFLSDW